MFFFDSANNGVPNEIWMKDNDKPLVNRIMKQGLEFQPPIQFTFYNNNISHQQGNTECGMYSLFFIITMLTGKTPFSKKNVIFEKEKRNVFTIKNTR